MKAKILIAASAILVLVIFSFYVIAEGESGGMTYACAKNGEVSFTQDDPTAAGFTILKATQSSQTGGGGEGDKQEIKENECAESNAAGTQTYLGKEGGTSCDNAIASGKTQGMTCGENGLSCTENCAGGIDGMNNMHQTQDGTYKASGVDSEMEVGGKKYDGIAKDGEFKVNQDGQLTEASYTTSKDVSHSFPDGQDVKAPKGTEVNYKEGEPLEAKAPKDEELNYKCDTCKDWNTIESDTTRERSDNSRRKTARKSIPRQTPS